MTGAIDMGGQPIKNLSYMRTKMLTVAAGGDSAEEFYISCEDNSGNTEDAESASPAMLLRGSGTMGPVIVRNVETPTKNQDAANKEYVDNAVSVYGPAGAAVREQIEANAQAIEELQGSNYVKTVNGSPPDESGNIEIDIPETPDLSGYVQSVNGSIPDENGNVEVDVSGGTETAELLYQTTMAEEVTYFEDTLPFNPMVYKRILVDLRVVGTTTNTAVASVHISLGNLGTWLPSWVACKAQNFCAIADIVIANGLSTMKVFYTGVVNGSITDTNTSFNATRYTYTTNDLNEIISLSDQNKYFGVGTSIKIWGMK